MDGYFMNGDQWNGYSYEEDGARWYHATDAKGREYETEEVPTRYPLDFGMIQFAGQWTEDQVKEYYNGQS